MRRFFAILLTLAMLLGGAHGESSAYELALELAQVVSQMEYVREMPLERATNRVIWNDKRTGAKCALIVYADEAAAVDAALADATRDTSVRTVDMCALYLDSDLGAEAIGDYQQALQGILGVENGKEEPDYILNVNTGKMHCPNCYSLLEMKQTNKLPYTGDREEAIAQDYVPCKICKP